MGALSTGFRVLDGKKDRSGQKYFKDRAVTPIHTGPSHPVNPVSKNGSSPVFGREEWTPGFNFGSLRAKDAHSTTLPPKLSGLGGCLPDRLLAGLVVKVEQTGQKGVRNLC